MMIKQKVVFALSLCFLVSLLFAIPSMSANAADNLAVNGDLELGSTTGWEIAAASIDSSVKYAGNYSLKMTATSAYAGAAYKIVPVGKGADVTVSFYYRYDSNPGSSNTYHVYTYKGANADNGTYSNADKSFSVPTGCNSISTWQKVSYNFNSGDFSSIYLKFCPGGNGSGTCYIDNLEVTATGGTEEKVDPYLTSFGTKYNRPANDSYNLIKNGGFESATDAQWNTATFLKNGMAVVEDATTRQDSKSLYLNNSSGTATWYTFPVTVEKYTQYTFSAWVKAPRLSTTNNATATFGVATEDGFLVYEEYNGNGYGSASLSTTQKQLMATSPDDQWHLRSVTFYSGTATTLNIAVYGAKSQLYLDDIALYKSAYGVEYISELRTATITATNNSGAKYCEDEHSLIPAPNMTGSAAKKHWSANPAWRNGFLSFGEAEDGHTTVLKYTASAKPLGLTYVDWIDVQPNTTYTLTMDVKRLVKGDGKVALLDDNINNPKEFYTVSFSSVDNVWKTYSITFNTGAYSRIGFAIVDGGGSAYIDKTRLFLPSNGLDVEPEEKDVPAMKPMGGETSVMEVEKDLPNLIQNSGFETGNFDGFAPYQSSVVSPVAAHTGAYGARLMGDGSWGAMVEQKIIPVVSGESYEFTYWYKANAGGANITLTGVDTGIQYAYTWANAGEWTQVTASFLVKGDTALCLNVCGGGAGTAEDVYLDDLFMRKVSNLGVAFLMKLDAIGATYNEEYVGDLSNAVVDVYGDGNDYKLVKMGALLTNKASIGTDISTFNHDYQDVGDRLADVEAVKLNGVTSTTVSYVVRLVGIPYAHSNTVIYARPYYVFEKDGEEITVYGDVYSRSYNNSGEDVYLD